MTKAQEDYAFFKSMGICPHCKKNKAAPNRVRCEECLARNAESAARQHEKNRQKTVRDYARERRERVKADGKCIWCGSPLSQYSKCFCPSCRVKNQRNNEARKNGVARSERYSYGICYRCGKHELVPGKKLCQTCYEQSIDNLPDSPKIITAWKRDNNRVFGRGAI